MIDDIDSIKKLPPKERIVALQELRQKRKRELEELEKKRREELEESEDVLENSLEELEEEELRLKRKQKEALEQLLDQEKEEESLEEKLAREKINKQEDNMSYDNKAYTPIQRIVDDLQGLRYTNNWGSSEQELYQQRKKELDQTKQYAQSMSESLVKQLDTAEQILDKMGYKPL